MRWPAAAGGRRDSAARAAAGGRARGRRAGRAAPSSWLVKAQNSDGGFGAAPGQASSRLYSGWAALGLAAAGATRATCKRRGGRSLAAYEQARRRARSSDIGEVERTVLVASAAGLSPRDFAGRT